LEGERFVFEKIQFINYIISRAAHHGRVVGSQKHDDRRNRFRLDQGMPSGDFAINFCLASASSSAVGFLELNSSAACA
jgi:hypothetical protein